MVADMHMSNKLSYAQPGANDQGITDRLQDQMNVWKRMYNVAKDRNVDAIFVLGDLFDRSLVDAITLTCATEVIMNSPAPMLLLPGNHDANSIKGGRFTVEAFGQVGKTRYNDPIDVIGFEGAERSYPVSGSNVVFWSIGFCPLEETRATLARFKTTMDSNEFNVLLLHNSILGAEHLGWVCDDGLDPEEICSDFDQVISGHFHRHQTFGDNGIYLGAPMQFNFGDAGNSAGFWIVEFTGKDVNFEFIPSKAPKFHVFKEWKNHTKKLRVKKGDYVRFEIAATHPEWIEQKVAAKTFCSSWEEVGIHASFKHKPIAQHAQRLGGEDEDGNVAVSMDKAISSYVDASSVVTEGLDSARLKRIGRDFLATAKVNYGN